MRSGKSRPPLEAVATDLDGTLLPLDGKLSQRTKNAIAAARKAGIAVIPATARPPASMLAACSGAQVGPIAICSNGAIAWDFQTERALFHQSISSVAASDIVSQLRQSIPGALFAFEMLDEFRYEIGMLDPKDAATWGITEAPVADLLDHLATSVTKLCCWHPDLSAAETAKLVSSTIGDAVAGVTSAGAGWALIGPPGITKAVGLARACAEMGIKLERVAAIGDEHNDLPMLAEAAWSVGVANARAEVLAVVDEVIPSNIDDGVALFLETLTVGNTSESDGNGRR